ncbi:condensation domain-containing protein, partial [Staphylococcus arlettae]
METKLLSYAQNEILQIEQYYENTSINNIAGIMHMRNGLEYAEINAAFNALVESHDSFRLQVTRHDGEYKQYVTDFQYH